jgi:hypothetical protein
MIGSLVTPKEKEQLDTKYPEILGDGDVASLVDISVALMN